MFHIDAMETKFQWQFNSDNEIGDLSKRLKQSFLNG